MKNSFKPNLGLRTALHWLQRNPHLNFYSSITRGIGADIALKLLYIGVLRIPRLIKRFNQEVFL